MFSLLLSFASNNTGDALITNEANTSFHQLHREKSLRTRRLNATLADCTDPVARCFNIASSNAEQLHVSQGASYYECLGVSSDTASSLNEQLFFYQDTIGSDYVDLQDCQNELLRLYNNGIMDPYESIECYSEFY